MDPHLELVPSTNEERQLAMLSFSAIVGGGVIAYELGRAIRDGGLFLTDPVPEHPKAGFIGMAGGLVMLGISVNEAQKAVGWKPILLGGAGVAAVAMIVRAIR